jgi:hypothetical protein
VEGRKTIKVQPDGWRYIDNVHSVVVKCQARGNIGFGILNLSVVGYDEPEQQYSIV